jgi:hypothetical protein
MMRIERTKLLVASRLERLRPLVQLFRDLSWPAPLQRLGQRGLSKLAARIPELARMLDGRPRTRQATVAVDAALLPDLLTELSARDYATRARAAQALAGFPRESAAIDALIQALRDRSVEVAVAATTALAVGGSARAKQALVAVLGNRDGYYHVLTRAAAVHGLATLLSGDAERAPLRGAVHDLDAEVSIAAITALGAEPSELAAERLLDVLENGAGYFLPITRLSAARALARLGGSASPRLAQLVQAEADANVAAVLTTLTDRSVRA